MTRKLELSIDLADKMGQPTLVQDYGVPYKVLNGTYYHVETPDAVIRILEAHRTGNKVMRIILNYGDTKTGISWGEVNDVEGYVGRSTGEVKVPLLLDTKKSSGGGSILSHCILQIKQALGNSSIVVYSHHLFKGDIVCS